MGGDDILIGGPTRHDQDDSTFTTISAAWNSALDLEARIENVRSGLNAATVFNDAAPDTLRGQGGDDWFFGDLVEASDRYSGELVDQEASLVNTAVTRNPDVQLMPSIAVNPLDPDHVVIAYMDWSLVDTGYAGIGVAVSHDGGTTWEQGSIPVPEPFDEGAANPKVEFDDRGHVFVVYSAATFLGAKPGNTTPDVFDPVDNLPPRIYGFQSHNGVFVVRSDDGGMNWAAPVEVESRLYEGQDVLFHVDPPSLAVDTFPQLPDGHPNPNYGNLYVVWADLYPGGKYPGYPEFSGSGDVYVAVSRDEGSSWEVQLEEKEKWEDSNNDGVRQEDEVRAFSTTVLQSIPLDAGPGFTFFGLPRASVGPAGDVYVSNISGFDFAVEHSDDGARSFEQPDPFHETDFRLAFGTGFRSVALESLANNHFGEMGTVAQRAIAADPTRPGHVYAAEVIDVTNELGEVVDVGDVFFARSVDHGRTWDGNLMVGAVSTNVLNDENRKNDSADFVVAGQAFVQLLVNERGHIAVVWGDQRRDPASKLVDIFGSVSMDGGHSFSPNFRITDMSFDAEAGSFVDVRGRVNSFLGFTLVDLALTDNVAYAAWTDTRFGNKDVYFSKYPLDPPPAALSDHFEPNDSRNLPAGPTDLGRVASRRLPNLALSPADEDWFFLQAAATGNLSVDVVSNSTELRIELWNRDGSSRVAIGEPSPREGEEVARRRILFPTKAGQQYLLRVSSADIVGTSRYSMQLQTLTEDFGTQVHGIRNTEIEGDEQFLYLVETAAPGSFEARVSTVSGFQGDLALALLDPNSLSVLADGRSSRNQAEGGSSTAVLSVDENQPLLIRVSGNGAVNGQFTLQFLNHDQFGTSGSKSLRFGAGNGPSEVLMIDLNGDARLDAVVSNALTDTISVLLGNGDGTLSAPRQFSVGAFVTPPADIAQHLPTLGRAIRAADFNQDGISDIVTTNYASADVSVLLGRGDGTFEPELRFNATAAPYDLDTGDLNADGVLDLVVADSTPSPIMNVAVLLGRGNGTFAPQIGFEVDLQVGFHQPDLRIADFDNDGVSDLSIAGSQDRNEQLFIFLGVGDGTFRPPSVFRSIKSGLATAISDFNRDSNPDLVLAGWDERFAAVHLGNGDGTFDELANPATGEPRFESGQGPVAVVAADLGSELTAIDLTLGPPDGQVDLIVANSGFFIGGGKTGNAEIVILPGLLGEDGQFVGFGKARQLAPAQAAQSLAAGDLNDDGLIDIGVVDRDAVLIIYGEPPNIAANNTLATARALGTVVHFVSQTRTIVPGREDAYFRLTVPTEAAPGAGDQVIDFSALFEALSGAGLSMELLDADGNVLATGERFRVRVAQGQELLLHIFGVLGADGTRGSGAYTLVIDVLPQVVSIDAQALLPGTTEETPGGPTTSLVISFQGDRLDPDTAQHLPNYTVTHAGPDNQFDTADDEVIPVTEAVYSPSTNVDISSGLTFPTAVKQTITLLFDDALPAGSYRVDLSGDIRTAPFNDQEDDLLANVLGFNGHPVVTLRDDQIIEGSTIEATDLVLASSDLGDFSVFNEGTPFLSQTHADLGAILDATLTELGDDAVVTPTLIDNLVTRLVPATGERGERPVSLMALWLDPTGIDLQSSQGTLRYDLSTGDFSNNLQSCYAEVGGNFEIIVCAVLDPLDALFDLTISDVPETARGGIVLIGEEEESTRSLTDEIRSGIRDFVFNFAGD